MMRKYFFILVLMLLAGCAPTTTEPSETTEQDLFAQYVLEAQQLFHTNVEIGITEEQDALELEHITYEAKDGIITKVTKEIEPLPLPALNEYKIANNTFALNNVYTLSWSTANNAITSLHITRNNETLKQQVYAMPLKERVGQLIVTGFEGTTVTPALQQAVEEHFISNVILFSKNITGHTQLLSLSENFHALRHREPLWLSIDEEGGAVSRLPDELVTLPTATQLAATHSADDVQQIAKHLGSALAAYGIQVDYAPVMDVNSNPQNPVIGTRSFSNDPNEVANFALSFHRGLASANVVSSMKHFPGHGDTNVDSHFDLPILNHSLDELNATELIPFRRAISDNVPMIMVGHLLIPALDAEQPTSISKKIIGDFLRTELGYNGLIITDDITMEALALPIETIAVQTIDAGADLVLIGHGLDKALAAQQAIIDAVENGTLSETRVNRSVMRVIAEKRKHGEANVVDFSVAEWNKTMNELLQ